MKIKSFFFLLALNLFIISACGGYNPAKDLTLKPTGLPVSSVQVSSKTGSFFTIIEVGLGQNGYVALTNFTDVPARLAGLYLCQGVECFELPDVVVAAGATARFTTGDGAGLEDVVATHATIGVLRPTDGEIALATSANPSDPQVLLLYFQWGSDPHELTRNAVEAGLWVKGGYAPSSQNAIRLFKDGKSGLWLFDEP